MEAAMLLRKYCYPVRGLHLLIVLMAKEEHWVTLLEKLKTVQISIQVLSSFDRKIKNYSMPMTQMVHLNASMKTNRRRVRVKLQVLCRQRSKLSKVRARLKSSKTSDSLVFSSK